MNDDIIMQRKSDIGLIREKNEDSTLILTHPTNAQVHLLAIADGMGGKEYGEIASSFVIATLKEWFVHISYDKLDQMDIISQELDDLIYWMNEDLIKKYGLNRLGTTLTLAFIGKEKTLILNIGDSRCYQYQNKKLTQVTEDDSQVWVYYKAGQVLKEDLRFFSTSNFINACIGLNESLCHNKKTILENSHYQMLILLTDGVTDLLTDVKMEEIIQTNKYKEILDKLIQEAVYVDQKLEIPPRLERNFFEPFYVPLHGKDNASGVIFIKK